MGSFLSSLQTVPYWPKATIFVSIVDPGVGSKRRSVVVLTEDGHYIITPDNGTLTHIAHYGTIKAVRLIDEEKNRLQGQVLLIHSTVEIFLPILRQDLLLV